MLLVVVVVVVWSIQDGNRGCASDRSVENKDDRQTDGETEGERGRSKKEKAKGERVTLMLLDLSQLTLEEAPSLKTTI